MNKDTITNKKSFWLFERKRYELCEKIIDSIGDKLSEDVAFSPSYFIQITVRSRDDLETLMTCAPIWTKSFNANNICYEAHIDGQRVQILAYESAMPGTCKMVEEEYEVPAEPAKEAVPAHVGKRMVLKCNHAKQAEAVALPEPTEAL